MNFMEVQNIYQVFFTLCFFFGIIVITSAYFYCYFSRKLVADLQARVGPSLTGPKGFLQPLADYLKLLQKQQRVSAPFSDVFWCHLYSMILFAPMVTIPVGSHFLIINSCAGPYLMLFVALVLALGFALTGFESSHVLIWYNSVRLISQSIAGSVSFLMSLLCVGVLVGGLRWSDIAVFQGFAPWQWICFATPFSFLACIVFLTSGLILMACAPMDSLFSDAEGCGSIKEGIFGRQLIFFHLAQYYVFLFWSITCIVLFFGAWNLPEFLVYFLKSMALEHFLGVLEFIVLMVKAFVLMLCCRWISAALPRPRVDQVVRLAWNMCAPGACIALIGSVAWSLWGQP